ncbi:putative DNA topoisomerase (ATP-hydrolyzing) [Medicago truncatula]|uniref:DNA topoisomerase 2 n=1 Tax=Medicago truncatula TaxID=3880 RepID=A0A396JP99_MEDTR|nr:DNA topoisomerase 2-like isoform X2 [Medicago truncatula]RHN79034.1 putative DNA topoisomerase (ATP-hydrolyzing) [Medicago truncatula]
MEKRCEPDTFIDSIKRKRKIQKQWVYEDGKIVHRKISYVPGLYNIFDIILVHAADKKRRDPSMNRLRVKIDTKMNEISVYHNGAPLIGDETFDDVINNFDLTNSYSTCFWVELADECGISRQEFSNNMDVKFERVVCKVDDYSTMVTFKPDLTKFEMTCLEEDVVALMKKRVLDMAGCLGDTVTVELISEVIPFNSFKGYADFFLNCAQESTPFPLPRTHAKLSDSLEICLSLSDGKFQQVSFVNSIATIKGGTHVDYITKQITTYIKKEVLKMKEHVNVNADTVKNRLWVFVNARIDNPTFHSQTKEMLTTKPARLGLNSRLTHGQKSEIAKTLLPRIRICLKRTHVETHVEAMLAGGSERGKCTLILTHGEFAFAMAGVSAWLDPDLYGVFPLSSKLLNVRDSRKLLKKKEIQILMTILGLVRNKKYSDAESLRYGRLMIMANQDEDGAYLKGLLINFIYSFWPSLLKVSKFMSVFTIPIIKASNSKEGKELSFDSMQQYEDWEKDLGNTSTDDWEIEYCKGFTAAQEVKEYFQDLGERRAYFVWDDDDEQDGTSTSIELAFSKKAEEWKAWVCNSQMMQPGTCNYESKSIKYRDFVNKELLFFSMKNLQRFIPSMVDGLTLGQRKTLFCSFKMKLTKPTEVFRLTTYVALHSFFHDDEQSIASTIIGMAQDFVGSNNINLLIPYGQFGTRELGGKDHASFRKLCIKLNCVTRLLFPVDDDKLLEYLNEDGKSVEPNWYIPIIPLVLVNGCHAMGTCFSSDIPKYHPCEIIENVRRFLNKEVMVPMKPWYRGFRGTIKKSAKGYTVNGLVERINEQTVRIEELPIRMWTEDYKKFLEKKTAQAHIESFRQIGVYEMVDFKVKMKPEKIATTEDEDKEELRRKFNLTCTISTSNMYLFDAEGKIMKYNSPEQILEEFCRLRQEYYVKRKEYLVKNFKQLLRSLKMKQTFITNVVYASCRIYRRAEFLTEILKKVKSSEPQVAGAIDYGSEEQKADEQETVATLGDYKYLSSLPLESFTRESLVKLEAELGEKKKELKTLKDTSPDSMWLNDLMLFEKEFDKLQKIQTEKDRNRSSMLKKKNDFAIDAKKLSQPRNNQKEADDDIPSLACHFESSSGEKIRGTFFGDLVQEKATPAKEGPTKAATTSKRKNVQPAESAGLSPNRKKVRMTRESPINKRSGSILDRAGNLDLSLNTDLFDDSTNDSYMSDNSDDEQRWTRDISDSDSDGQ